MTDPQPDNTAAENDRPRLTVFVMTHDWTGLHDMFEEECLEKMAGVPLVPMLWKTLADNGHDVHVFVIGRYLGTHAESGQDMESVFAHDYEVRDGRVVKFRQFADTWPMVAAMRGETP